MAIRHLQLHIPKFTADPRLLAVSLMLFFFVIFDGVLMYLAPIIMTHAGVSASLMGLIIGSSSIAGMIFDLILCRLFEDTNYRRMFLFMFTMAALYPFFLFGGATITMYIVAMAVWGFYYDFYNIGTIDFVGRTTNHEHHASSFGVLRVFEGSGYLVAPLIGSLLLLYLHPGLQMFLVILLPLLISFFICTIFVLRQKKEKDEYVGVVRKDVLSFFAEMHLWKNLWATLMPVLLLTLSINLIDAAIWTFGPLFSEQLGTTNGFSGGAFMTAYALPPLLAGWVVGIIARRFEMKHAAQWAIAVGSLFLICVGLSTSAPLLIVLIFVASFFLAIGWPSINSLYSDHVDSNSAYSKEIETLQDLFTNFGDIAGPIAGGYMAEYLGFTQAFVSLGVMGLGMSLVLFLMKPRILPLVS